MCRFFLALSFLLAATLNSLTAEEETARQLVFEGPWHTTNRKLDGVMTCVATPLPNDQWQGRFYGVWQGVPFDYTVRFKGPHEQLEGKAAIDGADYSWKGEILQGTTRTFKGTFGGSRYTGHFELKERPVRVVTNP